MSVNHKLNHAATWESESIIVESYVHQKFQFLNTTNANSGRGQVFMMQDSYTRVKWVATKKISCVGMVFIKLAYIYKTWFCPITI